MSALTPRRRWATPPRGIRHAALLSLCFVVPASHAVGSAAASRIEGFPVWAVVVITAVVAVAMGLLGVDAKPPGITGIASRLVGAAVLALAVRMTVPTPGTALAEVRDGDALLVSGAALVVFGLLVLSATVGHLVTTRLVTIAAGQPTTQAARAYGQQLLTTAWGSGLGLLVLAGLTHGAAGLLGQLLFVAALVIALAAIADLRGRIPPPGATRPPIVAAPRSVLLASIAMALLAAVTVTAIVVPTLPEGLQDGLGRPSEWLAELDIDWTPERAPVHAPEGDRAQIHGREDIEPRRIPWAPDRIQEAVPLWVQVLAGIALLSLLLLILRPERWVATVRRLWTALRGGRWDDEEAVFDELEPLEDDDAGGRRGRFRDALERVRPRPRDPRQAIVHDYLRVQRQLTRNDEGRRRDETPLEHAARLRTSWAGPSGTGADLSPLDELAGLVSTARYGPAAPSPAIAERSRELQQVLERELRNRG
jgi:hypothetical protein